MPNQPKRRGALAVLRDRVLSVPAVSKKRKAVALTIAVTADLVQLVLWPAFAGGVASPADDVLDVVVAMLLLVTLGFSVRLALGLAIELTPGAALFPTWSAVVASIPARETNDEADALPASSRA